MAVSMAESGRSNLSEINMTPMIDVLLVLLVIFIIAQPMMQKAIDVQLPRDGDSDFPSVVLQIEPNGVIHINTLAVEPEALQARLAQLYQKRPNKIILVKASPEVRYQEVITAMDAARGAGVKVIGAVLPGQAALGR